MGKRNAAWGNYCAGFVEALEARQFLTAVNILVNSQNGEPLRLYSQSGTLLATSNYPTQSSPNAGDGGSANALVVDANNNIQLFTGGFNPFLQRHNGPLTGSGGWTTEQTTIKTPGWSLVGRTFYGGLATIGQYVFATDMATGSGGDANGLIRFDSKNSYAPLRFASGSDYSDVTLGMDGNIYGLVSPPGQPSSSDVNVFDPNTLKLIRTIHLTDTDDAAVVADAQGNIYTSAFGGQTRKISPAGVILKAAPIAATDMSISTDGKILSCEGNHVRLLDANLNILGGFNVSSPFGAVFASFDTYQAPPPKNTTGSVAGSVFADINNNGTLDPGEKGMAGVKVYLDTNKNGTLDAGETFTNTDSSGNYTFASVNAGAYRLRQVVPANYIVTSPVTGYYDVTVSPTSPVIGKAFADVQANASISGKVFNDFNGNGTRDKGELGLGLWQVVIDFNNNGKLNVGYRTTLTDINGNYTFAGLIAGTYTVRVVPVAGAAATTAAHTFRLAAGQPASNILFGERSTA